MKILFFHPQLGGVSYYRAETPGAALRALGHDVTVLSVNDEAISTHAKFERWILDNSREYDIAHVGYFTEQEYVKSLVCMREYAELPFVTDIDDDIYNVPEYNIAFNGYHGGAQNRRIARMQLRTSDAIATSTAPLAEVMQRDSRHVAHLPNCLSVDDWAGLERPRRANDGEVRIMFAGNIGRYGDLEHTKEALQSVMRSHKNVRLYFLGCLPEWAAEFMPSDTDPHANRCFVVAPCRPSAYRAALAWISPDILINPVDTNIFNTSKSHIKAYDAAMCGAAFVCTDWDTHADIPKECAIKLDNKPAQWEGGLSALIGDASMRQGLHERLKQWALDTQTIDKHVDKWVKLYENTIARGPITALSEIVRPGVGGGDGLDRSTATAGHEEQSTG